RAAPRQRSVACRIRRPGGRIGSVRSQEANLSRRSEPSTETAAASDCGGAVHHSKVAHVFGKRGTSRDSIDRSGEMSKRRRSILGMILVQGVVLLAFAVAWALPPRESIARRPEISSTTGHVEVVKVPRTEPLSISSLYD